MYVIIKFCQWQPYDKSCVIFVLYFIMCPLCLSNQKNWTINRVISVLLSPYSLFLSLLLFFFFSLDLKPIFFSIIKTRHLIRLSSKKKELRKNSFYCMVVYTKSVIAELFLFSQQTSNIFSVAWYGKIDSFLMLFWWYFNVIDIVCLEDDRFPGKLCSHVWLDSVSSFVNLEVLYNVC